MMKEKFNDLKNQREQAIEQSFHNILVKAQEARKNEATKMQWQDKSGLFSNAIPSSLKKRLREEKQQLVSFTSTTFLLQKKIIYNGGKQLLHYLFYLFL